MKRGISDISTSFLNNVNTETIQQIDATLESVVRFAHVLVAMNYKGAEHFIKFIEKKIQELKNPNYEIKKVNQLRSEIERAQKSGYPQGIIYNLQKKLDDEISHIDLLNTCRVCAQIKDVFSNLILNPLKKIWKQGALNANLQSYLSLIQSQLLYMYGHSLVLQTVPIAENAYQAIPYLKYNLDEKFSKPQSNNYLNNMGLLGGSILTASFLASESYFPPATLMLGSALGYFAKNKIQNTVAEFVGSWVTSKVDKILLASENFERRCNELHAVIQKNKIDLSHIEVPELPNAEFSYLSSFINDENLNLLKDYLNANIPLSFSSYQSLYTLSQDTLFESFKENYSLVKSMAIQKIAFATNQLYSISKKIGIKLNTKVEDAFIQAIDVLSLVREINEKIYVISELKKQPQTEDIKKLLKELEDGLPDEETLEAICNDALEKCYTAVWGLAYKQEGNSRECQNLFIMAQSLVDDIYFIAFPKNILESNTAYQNVNYINLINYILGFYALQEKMEMLDVFEKASFSEKIQCSQKENQSTNEKSNICSANSCESNVSITEKLFLFSSGGGGHKQAMEAELRESMEWSINNGEQIDKNYSPIKIDLMLDWLGLIGEFAVNQWNDAQKQGDVEKQEKLVSQQPMSNFLFGPVIYYKMYNVLKENPNIKEVVNTQAMCNKQVCQAVLDINRKYGRDIRIKLVMTDLPTPRAIHFWNGIKSFSPLERTVITLHTIAPLKEDEHASYHEFFDFYCEKGLNWVISPPPVRKEFKEGKHRNRTDINQSQYLSFQWNFEDERQKLISLQDVKIDDQNNKIVRIPITEQDKLMSIMLGSQGGQAILDYVHEVIREYEKNPKQPLTFLVYCGQGQNESSALFRQVVNLIQQKGNLPKGLRIIPLGNQGAISISEALVRTDVAIMRTGGLASFEALVISEQNKTIKFLLHSESKSKDNEDLLKSIPVWERGNAEFLVKKTGATVVNVPTFSNAFNKILSEAPLKALELPPSNQDKSVTKMNQSLFYYSMQNNKCKVQEFSNNLYINRHGHQYFMQEQEIKNDGDCMLRAVFEWLKKKRPYVLAQPINQIEITSHTSLRVLIAQALRQNQDALKDSIIASAVEAIARFAPGFVDLTEPSVDGYLNVISKDKTWLGELELCILADLLSVNVEVFEGNSSTYYYAGQQSTQDDDICLHFVNNNHYNLLLPSLIPMSKELNVGSTKRTIKQSNYN